MALTGTLGSSSGPPQNRTLNHSKLNFCTTSYSDESPKKREIACQIHRSPFKWDFIPEWEGRIEFGSSVFHGLQPPVDLFSSVSPSINLKSGDCQMVKDVKGSGAQLKELIPGLRVTGYHRRLFILDIQAEHYYKVQTSYSWSMAEGPVTLRARKFELANLDRGHTRTNSTTSIGDQIEKATKGHEHGIQATIRAYERLRKDMMMMRGKDGVAKDAYIPPENHELSVQVGRGRGHLAGSKYRGVGSVSRWGMPAWLSDASVRVGIRAAQEVVNCKEELKRCAG
ncbi:hypothetical protein BS47DRAFT_1437857 [Hydnum rufescens UP504]|uniref:Uncharacterized protein n=1 Tax=Hydnum rufescens UP504 TaxID=1448309 RepID=A0A9P6B3J3_9AGAM|nr:hypothetical protein BS47DRAFT_1437857 [Hydnum rufescens UP504]